MRRLAVTDPPFAALPDLALGGDDPAHARIERWLAELVTDGGLDPGDRLPPEAALAERLGVSRMTLRQALASLETRDLVLRRRGRGGGTFVIRPRIDCDVTGLSGFTEQMRRAHVRAGAHVVSAGTEPAPTHVADALRIGTGSPAHRVVRVRLADDEPLALEDSWLPVETFPGFCDHDLSGSLYELMGRHYDAAPATADEWLEPVLADDPEAGLLGAVLRSPLMLVTRTAYDARGLPVEHARDRYRADRCRIHLRATVS